MTDLDKAREWAERWSEDDPLILADAKAAIKLIKALPDQWVSVEKVLEAISGQLSVYTRGTVSHYIAEEITRKLKEALITPKLPTLADMTQEEREACQWMQCEVETDDADIIGVIRRIRSKRVGVIFRSGMLSYAEHRRVTPLPDLPKLKWPGGGDTPTISNKEKVAGDQAVAKDVCNSEPNSSETPKSSIKPDDVIPNQPWLVEINGEKYVGTRFSGVGIFHPWAVAALDGSETFSCDDMAITLIHKLVPEPPSLPEGMRLADHEEYGRVVVAPRLDDEGDYWVFHSIHSGTYGADLDYVDKSELTFLDGDQHA